MTNKNGEQLGDKEFQTIDIPESMAEPFEQVDLDYEASQLLQQIDKKKAAIAQQMATKSFKHFCLYMASEVFEESRTNPDKKFIVAPEHEIIFDRLEMVAQGKLLRVIISTPPRFGKTVITATLMPLYLYMLYPGTKVINLSCTKDLAEKSSLVTRTVIQSEKYKAISKARLSRETKGKEVWKTAQGGTYLSVGLWGQINGKDADYLLIDDYVKHAEEAYNPETRKKIYGIYSSVAEKRLNSDTGALVIIATRWHPDDLIGTLKRQAKHTQPKFRFHDICFPALIPLPEDQHYDKLIPYINPETGKEDHYFVRIKDRSLMEGRFTTEYMYSMRDNDVSGWEWDALYMQDPKLNKGGVFDIQKVYKTDHNLDKMRENRDRPYQVYIDPAFSDNRKSDFTALAIYSKISKPSVPQETVNSFESLDDNEKPRPINDIEYPINYYRNLFVYKSPVSETCTKICKTLKHLINQGVNIQTVNIEKSNHTGSKVFNAVFKHELSNHKLPISVKLLTPSGKKESRIEAFFGQALDSNHILINSNAQEDALIELEKELVGFPDSLHDDVLDVCSMAIEHYLKKTPNSFSEEEFRKSVQNANNVSEDDYVGDPFRLS